MRPSMEEVVNLLKAKVQCIWIETYEELDAIKDIKEITTQFSGIKLKSWSHTEGLRTEVLSSKETPQPPDKKVGIDKIFPLIKDAQDNNTSKDESIWIIKDLQLISSTHQVKRSLRDTKEHLGVNYNPIIVISPIVDMPIEWEKLFTIIHFETPERGAVEIQVDKFISVINKAIAKGKDYSVPTTEERKQLINACLGLTNNEILDVLTKSIVKYKNLSLKAVMEEKIQLVEKSGVLDYKLPEVSFDDVGGNSAFKHWIQEIEESMTEEAKEFGCIRPKGYLALGVPGTAKSFLAEAIANKWGVPLLKLNMSRIMNKLVGESEKRIDQAFKVAKACQPCVMLWDEVEKALSGTKSSNASDAGTTSRVFAACLQFLVEDNGVFVVMTSNDVTQLPPELTRSGRLDAMWYFSLPTLEERKDIFTIHLGKTNKKILDDLVDVGAKATANYTGAEIQEIVKAAMRKAFKRFKEDGSDTITEEDLLSAVKDTIPIYESSKEKIAYLEQWVHGRARHTNGQTNDEYNTGGDDRLLEDVLQLT